ncbi:hypothetical protein Q8A67_021906 [Cirrhinus molitorella]|uniref:Uncharacterized protein n=1 Tax=Cirrhinus molitorella TaxID=172907 RepID=A0AA88TN65_9TELE|nr:hypothetical protein Q8A67_021906 [Cirrhinus molitorella]
MLHYHSKLLFTTFRRHESEVLLLISPSVIRPASPSLGSSDVCRSADECELEFRRSRVLEGCDETHKRVLWMKKHGDLQMLRCFFHSSVCNLAWSDPLSASAARILHG